MWYRTKEHADRSLFWQSSEGFSFIICDLISYAIARYASSHGGIAAWRCISLFLRSLTLAGAGASFFLLGTPHEVQVAERERETDGVCIEILQEVVGKKLPVVASLQPKTKTLAKIRLGESGPGRRWLKYSRILSSTSLSPTPSWPIFQTGKLYHKHPSC